MLCKSLLSASLYSTVGFCCTVWNGSLSPLFFHLFKSLNQPLSDVIIKPMNSAFFFSAPQWVRSFNKSVWFMISQLRGNMRRDLNITSALSYETFTSYLICSFCSQNLFLIPTSWDHIFLIIKPNLRRPSSYRPFTLRKTFAFLIDKLHSVYICINRKSKPLLCLHSNQITHMEKIQRWRRREQKQVPLTQPQICSI